MTSRLDGTGNGDEAGGDARVAADGSLLVASYPCERGGGSYVLVERLSPSSGKPAWQWRTVSVGAGNPASFIGLAVVGVASAGEIVLLQGQVSKPGRYVRTLPNARRWPPALGPEGDEMLLALDARDGRPRWSELGFQNPELALTDGAVCEFRRTGRGVPRRLDGAAEPAVAEDRPVGTGNGRVGRRRGRQGGSSWQPSTPSKA